MNVPLEHQESRERTQNEMQPDNEVLLHLIALRECIIEEKLSFVLLGAMLLKNTFIWHFFAFKQPQQRTY